MQKIIKALAAVVLCVSLGLSTPLSKSKIINLEDCAVVKSVGLEDAGGIDEIAFVESLVNDASSAQKQSVIAAKDKNFADAMRKAQILADKYLTFSFVNDYIIGMPTAKKGISSCLDFISCSKKAQLSSFVYFSESDARSLLEDISKDVTSTDEVLLNLNNSGSDYGYYYPVTVTDLLCSDTMGESAVPIIGQKTDGENTAKKSVIVFKGYAIIKNMKAVYTIDKRQSRAYNILNNKLKKSFVDVLGNVVKINKAHCKYSFNIAGNRLLGAAIDIDLSMGIDSVSGANLNNEKIADFLRVSAEKELTSEIEELLKTAHSNNSDILNLGSKIRARTGKAVSADFRAVEYCVRINSRFCADYNFRKGLADK